VYESSAVEKMWHIYDSQGLGFQVKILQTCLVNNGNPRVQKYARELGAYDRVANTLSEGKPVYKQRGGESVLYFAEQASNPARSPLQELSPLVSVLGVGFRAPDW